MKKPEFVILSLLVILFLSLCRPVGAAHPVEIYFFYSQSCPICHEAGIFLGGLVKKYPEIKIKSFEMTNSASQQAYFAFGQAYGIDLSQTPVPFILIDEKAFDAYTTAISSEIEQTVIKCLGRDCISPLEKLESLSEEKKESGTNKAVIWILTIAVIIFIIFLLRKPKNEK